MGHIVDWELVAATGEWAGAGVVVATLFYLAMQVRQQNQFSRYTALKDLLDAINQPNKLMATNPKLRGVFRRGMEDPDSLSDEEAEEFSYVFRLYYNQMLKLQRAYVTNLIDPADWNNFGPHFAQMLFSKGGQRWLDLQGDNFSDVTEAYKEHYVEGETHYDLSMGRSRSR